MAGIDLPPLVQEIRVDTSQLERPVPTGGVQAAVSDIDKKMLSLGKTMSRVGGTLTRYVTLPLAGMGFMFSKAFSDAAKAGDPASQRIMAQWEQLRQKFGQVSVVVAQTLAPAIERAVNAVTRLADRFLALPRGAQSLIIFGALGAAALGPLLGTVGRLTAGIGYVIRLFKMLHGAAAAATTATTAAATAAQTAVSASTAASAGAARAAQTAAVAANGAVQVSNAASTAARTTFLGLGPIGWTLLAITGAATLLVGAFTLLWRYSEAFRNALHGVGEIIRTRVVPIVRNFVHALMNVLRPVFARIGEKIGEMVEKVRKWLEDNREKINHWAQVAIAAFRLTVEFAVAVLWPALKAVFGNIVEIIGFAIRTVQSFFKIMAAGGGAIAKFAEGDIIGAVKEAWKAGDLVISIGEDFGQSVADNIERQLEAGKEIAERAGAIMNRDYIQQVFDESKVDLFAPGEESRAETGTSEETEAPIPEIPEAQILPIEMPTLPPAEIPSIEKLDTAGGKFEAAAKDMTEAAKEQKKAAETIQVAMSRSGRTIEVNGLLVREPPEAIREWFHEIARAASL